MKYNNIIKVESLNKTYISDMNFKVKALNNIDLEIRKDEFVCIVGPSGCGKSTLLRIIAGLEKATSGTVSYLNKKLTKPTEEIGMVFQDYSLLPWKTVWENISLGLEFKKRSKKEREEVAEKYLELIGMEKFKNAYPYELSGGMQQRVAIARALANKPEVLLMDEPFGALDAYTRVIMQNELLKIWEKEKVTILFVTHSVSEAIYLADRIVVLSSNPGEIERIIEVDIPRPRDRGNPKYGELSETLLNLLEGLNSENMDKTYSCK